MLGEWVRVVGPCSLCVAAVRGSVRGAVPVHAVRKGGERNHRNIARSRPPTQTTTAAEAEGYAWWR